MPIYEFICNHCNESFEERTTISNRNAKPPCPSCGSKKTARQLSNVGVGKSSAPISRTPAHSSGCGCCSRRASCGIN